MKWAWRIYLIVSLVICISDVVQAHAQVVNRSSVTGVISQNNMQITGGTITGTSISAVPSPLGIRSSGAAFDLQLGSSEVLTANRLLSFVLNDGAHTVTVPATTVMPIITQAVTISGPSAARTITVPDANFTVARTDAANTFSGTQSFSAVSTGSVSASSMSTTTLSVGGGSAGQTTCWKTATALGFCSTVVGVTGACTCN